MIFITVLKIVNGIRDNVSVSDLAEGKDKEGKIAYKWEVSTTKVRSPNYLCL